jgi:hypothetical protein
MSLYDKASIALIPSGTKASTLYSVLPANGDGDFTHSRSNTTATRVNKDGLIEDVGSNIPRLNYPLTNGVAGDCPHLLLEPQRLNYSNYTEALSNWVDENVTTTDNQAVSPDGSVNASKIVENSSNTFHFISKVVSSTTTANNLVFTCFLKKGTRTNAYIYFRTYSNANRYGISVNLENGTITDTEQSGSPVNVETSVTDYGNDWYRVKVRMYQVSGTATMLIGPNNNTTINGINNTYQGDGSSYIYAWGTQLEVGDFETSYIPSPNSATQVTRSADVCNGSGTSADINSEEGVLFLEFSALDNDLSERRLSISNSTSGNVVRIGFTSVSNRILGVIYNGSNQAVLTTQSYTITDFHKVALKYKQNDFALWVDGTEVSTDTNGTTFAAGLLSELAFDNGAGGSLFFGKIKQALVFNEALSDSELATLTS